MHRRGPPVDGEIRAALFRGGGVITYERDGSRWVCRAFVKRAPVRLPGFDEWYDEDQDAWVFPSRSLVDAFVAAAVLARGPA